jgi:hypothetical protein
MVNNKEYNMTQARFEAVWFEGERDERMECWNVVEWHTTCLANGARQGRTVESFYEWNGEQQAKELAEVLQTNHNRELYHELG